MSRIEVGSQVIEEVVWSSTHDGDMTDGVIPPTHKSMETPACMINTFKTESSSR